MSEVKYSKEHEWIKIEGDVGTIGITQHATEMLGDIVFVELPEVGTSVEKDGNAGVVESTKAASDVFTPISGEVMTSPDIGVKTSLAALVDSTTPALPSFSTEVPTSGNSTKTISPSISVACCVIPIVPTSPSILIHSCSLEYLTSLI